MAEGEWVEEEEGDAHARDAELSWGASSIAALSVARAAVACASRVASTVISDSPPTGFAPYAISTWSFLQPLETG